VTFFKTVADDYGHDREIRQQTIEVSAADKHAALSKGTDEFCRLRGLTNWSQHVDRYEVSDAE
jgi:hypothetical protein